VSGSPTLIVVSGPAGAGKTTLAHELARAVGCPAICRDEIKEGMVHASPDVVPGERDELSLRTLPTFFDVLELLLRAGVTTVAEAAFQDRLWRPALEPLRSIARIRIVHCAVAADEALERVQRRWTANPLRRAHGGQPSTDAAAHAHSHPAFDRVSVDTPWIEVDTTVGYAPGLDDIVAFINA
jgi:predicted kinase